jgi:hypothetical protein
MSKRQKGVFFPVMVWMAAAVMAISMSAFATSPGDAELNNPNRGPIALDDDCGDCTIDYTGLRWLGSGGFGGRGVVHWPSGSTGNNYGQMNFLSTCEDLGEPAYAWCVDIYHPLETFQYGVNIDPLIIEDDSCSKAQLTAMAYLFAWTTPASTFEDDAFQIALWKLSDIRDGGLNDGLPHFCYDAGIGYPNFGDTPTYPYLNTVYTTNPDRNTWANNKILDALGKNVILPGDVITDECEPAVIEGDSATVEIKFCLERGEFAQFVGDTCVENVALDICCWIGESSEPICGRYYTDANGCVELSITQAIETRYSVDCRVCSNSAWPTKVVGCEDSTYMDNQWLVFGNSTPMCFPFHFEGDKWLFVELAGFDAYTTMNGVDLQWSTASETNADHWEVERCVSGLGNFTKIAELASTNQPTGATYQYADRNGTMGESYDYRLVDIDVFGVRTVHPNTVSAQFGGFNGAVIDYNLADAYPNPFNPTTTISFTIPEAGAIELRIFDLSGREVATLVNGVTEAGTHTMEWNAAGLPSGTYFYSLKSAEFTATKKLLLLK